MDIQDHGHFIAGKTVSAASGAHAEVLDPATNQRIARVAAGTKEDVDAAVEAARHAFESPEWRDLDPSKRGRLLWLVGQQVRDHFEELAQLESLNVGKPLREAKGDIAYVYKLFEYYAGLADKIQGDTIPLPGARLVTPVTLELGGKNPNIVFVDAKMDRAVRGVISGIFQNAGQMCWAGSRLFVHESIRADFLRTLVRATADLRLGPGSEEATQMGPLVSRDQERSVIEYIEGGGRGGARGLIGGHKANSGEVRARAFVEPPDFA